MSEMLHRRDGFTLIEVLIVVALIGILAVIAIPQFQTYRMRGFNAAAKTDLRNVKTAQESLYLAFNTYGITEGTAAAPVLVAAASGGSGPGSASTGPVPAAEGVRPGVVLTGPTQAGGVCALGIGISNGVTIVVDSLSVVPPHATSISYTAYAKHQYGSRVYAIEAENEGMFFVQNNGPGFVGQVLQAGGAPAVVPIVTQGTDITEGTLGGGSPNPNWSAF